MAIVQGIREKVHLPIYDSLSVEPGKQLKDAEPGSILKFFVDVQKKTKLETNLQSASLLPHYNTFEARAMRVVISDLPPVFPEDVEVIIPGRDSGRLITTLSRAMELLELARASDAGETTVTVGADERETEGGTNLILSEDDIEAEISLLKRVHPKNSSTQIMAQEPSSANSSITRSPHSTLAKRS